ncbi:MAG: hypothetical protein ACLSBB_13095 [Ruthenibacterium lactatiformans]
MLWSNEKAPDANIPADTGRYPITGTTAAESVLRTTSWIGKGCNTFSDSPRGKAKSNPLSAWLEQDILHYIKRRTSKYAACTATLFTPMRTAMNTRKIRFHPMRRCAVRDARGQGACSARLVRTSKKEKHVSSGFAAPTRDNMNL